MNYAQWKLLTQEKQNRFLTSTWWKLMHTTKTNTCIVFIMVGLNCSDLMSSAGYCLVSDGVYVLVLLLYVLWGTLLFFFYTNNLKVEGAAVYGGSQMNWLCNNVTWWTVCVNNRVTQHTFRGLDKSRKTCTPALVYCQIIIPRSMLLINKNNKKPQGCYNNKAMRETHHQKDKACGQEPTRGGQPVSYEDWQEDHSSV